MSTRAPNSSRRTSSLRRSTRADAQAILLTTCAALARTVAGEAARQGQLLSRRGILEQSMSHLRLLIVEDLERAFEIANAYAPEHLLLQVRDARRWLPAVKAAGAVFLGDWSPETMGDYCSGPNHTLPTYGHARAYSGLSLADFQKHISVQELTPQGLLALSGTARILAALEGLDGHAAAVTVRLEALQRIAREAQVREVPVLEDAATSGAPR